MTQLLLSLNVNKVHNIFKQVASLRSNVFYKSPTSSMMLQNVTPDEDFPSHDDISRYHWVISEIRMEDSNSIAEHCEDIYLFLIVWGKYIYSASLPIHNQNIMAPNNSQQHLSSIFALQVRTVK